jgi:cytochrome b subunit of formate dehydrogenase
MSNPARATRPQPGSPDRSGGAPRTDTPTFVIHWAMVIALVVSLLTGLRIATSDNHVNARWLEPLMLQGDVGRWHVWSAYLLLAGALAYVVLLWRASLGGRVRLSADALAADDGEQRRRAWNRLLYWVAFGLLAVAGVTGSLMYFGGGLVPEAPVATLHQWAAWGFVGYVVLHVLAQVWLGGVAQLLKILRPRMAYGAAGALALGMGGVAWAVLSGGDRAATPDLHMRPVAQLPTIDGKPDDAAWQSAPVVTVHTVRGANFPGGETDVRIRAVHTPTEAAFLFEWRDATRSLKHLPMVKTAEGWEVQEHKYAKDDEDDFYEDKFAVMFSKHDTMGGGASQLGTHPLKDKPAPNAARGLHYTTDGSLVDVWHWKGVRSGGIGQIDDNYFGPPLPAKEGKRYTGGYSQDPKTSGGFDQNWDKIAGSRFVTPKRLPKDMAALQARLRDLRMQPDAPDTEPVAMQLAETVPYSKELDTYPVGTVLPSVVLEGPFVGDRGDVSAVATWSNGWWRLEARRKLDTGSKFDLPFQSGLYLWVSAFDHTQARHTRHVHPVRLIVD